MSGKARSAESARTIRDFGAAADDGARGHYDDPAYYAKTYKDRRHDIDYYVRLARESKGPVLEYGVGNGRIALHVARAGIEVFGVLDGRIDLVLDGGHCSGMGATTVDITEPYWRLIKEGAIPERDIAECLKGA